jgi:hypothetical protein
MVLGAIAAAFAAYGSLDSTTSFGSLAFVVVFGAVSYLAFRHRDTDGSTPEIPTVGVLGTATGFPSCSGASPRPDGGCSPRSSPSQPSSSSKWCISNGRPSRTGVVPSRNAREVDMDSNELRPRRLRHGNGVSPLPRNGGDLATGPEAGTSRGRTGTIGTARRRWGA